MSEVVDVAGQNEVVVSHEESNVGVDDIARGSVGAQLADSARNLAVESLLVDTSEQPNQERLAGATLPPNLGHAARRRHDLLSATSAGFDERRHFSVSSLEPHQRARVEHQPHSGGPFATSPLRALEDTLGAGHLVIR